ncbi:winged helix-turn-helix domain-containing protein [Shewanella sp.]|uniref:winged helix-turn-helix domain-containing protein n=1 Tax=Shewanella sp. TaxID=50422 RepID=UPI001ED444AC|nr:winged helix-turn-helix domain-containing protein [Shewanella sp.]NRB23119.1 winged helix-turn-helix domain-containing protein [Shewanella sp.]
MSFQFAQYSFDSQSGVLTHSEKPEQALRHKVAGLLQYLIEHQDRIVSKEELLETLWQHGDYRENSLTQSIRELRLALNDSAKQPSYIKTYPQRGYQWICPLKDIEQQEHLGIKKAVVKKPAEIMPSTVSRFAMPLIALILVIGLGSGLGLGNLLSNIGAEEKHSDEANAMGSNSLLVLPFINATNDPTMAWLELGLSDMLAIDLQRSNQLKVTPPALANTLLLGAELEWPTLPIHIRSLLRDRNIDSALYASVRLHNEQQVFDFKLIHADGRNQQGSISYPSLPAASRSISQQLLYLLRPGQERQTTKTTDDPIAAQALAQGMQALQEEGSISAQKYFQASLTIQEDNPWTQAWLARSRYALGQWQQAEKLFNDITSKQRQADISLDAFIAYWLAELAYRRGDEQLQGRVDDATAKAEQTLDPKLMAQNYRLQANIAWNAMAWEIHHQWMIKAKQVFIASNDLTIEADKLFYLGNPSNEGLEKNPQNDLLLNQARLQKALNFYQQLNNQPMIAASQLAIAQNYSIDLPTRENALKQALSLYRELQQPFELAQALIYAGFYQVQLHEGMQALNYFNEAKQIATALGSKPLLNISDFYIAFAMLDQGLDQTALGSHPTQAAKLERAIVLLEGFIRSLSAPYYHASALVFLGWAHTDLGNYDQALEVLSEAKALNKALNMETSFGYSSYSIMRIHLERQDYPAVIAMSDDKITTRLQASFLARAYFENNQIDQAIATLSRFKQQHPSLWQHEDTRRLLDYQNSKQGIFSPLQIEPKAHLVYCESDWAH